MAFTLEDGTGVTGANSYASVADAETYFTDVGKDVTAWSALSTAAKQSKLIVATQYVDGVYGSRFSGYAALSTQGLEWPRKNAIDQNGWLLSSAAVPDAVKFAMYEVAFRLLTVDALPDTAASDKAIKETMDQIGPLKRQREYDQFVARVPSFPLVDAILAPLLRAGGVMELVRA
jgi:hypothetical protein